MTRLRCVRKAALKGVFATDSLHEKHCKGKTALAAMGVVFRHSEGWILTRAVMKIGTRFFKLLTDV